MRKTLCIIYLTLVSCIPFKKEPQPSTYVSSAPPFKVPPTRGSVTPDIENQLNKELEWNSITKEAISSYKDIHPIINKKCASCHDSDKPLPFYGKLFQRRNIFKKHRDDGLDNVDFSLKFPLVAKGDPPQLAILKAIRSSVTERTMPIKLYKVFYPRRRVTDKDEEKILGWIEPLVERIEQFNEKYNRSNDDSIENRVATIFTYSCNRCHGNGNTRGDFGGMDNLQALSKSKYINKESPEKSELYQYIKSGEMPPSRSEKLSDEEAQVVLNWIESLE